MSKTSSRTPSYRKHKATGQAVVTLNGKDHYLGLHGSAKSKDAYDRLIAEWLGAGLRLASTRSLTIAELIHRAWQWIETHYRRADGSVTSEVGEFRYSLRPLAHLYRELPATDFRPLAFKTVRELMV